MASSASGTQGHKRVASDASATFDTGKGKKARENTPSDHYSSPSDASTDSELSREVEPHCLHIWIKDPSPSQNVAVNRGLCVCTASDESGVERCIVGNYCWDDGLIGIYKTGAALMVRLEIEYEFIQENVSSLSCSVVGCPNPTYAEVKESYIEEKIKPQIPVGPNHLSLLEEAQNFVTTKELFKPCWCCFSPICFHCQKPCNAHEASQTRSDPVLAARCKRQHLYSAFKGLLRIGITQLVAPGEPTSKVLCEELVPRGDPDSPDWADGVWVVLEEQKKQVYALYCRSATGSRRPGSAGSNDTMDSLEQANLEIAKMESRQHGQAAAEGSTAGPSGS